MRRPNRYLKIFGIDDVLVGALVSGAGGLVTNMFNKDNVEDTNRQNAANVAATNAANMLEAQKNRDFQERMSNSAYQRAMQDMDKAGLNPILAYQKGGASSPSGGQAALTAPHAASFKAENPVTEAVNTGLALRRSNQELENMKYTAENIQQNTAESVSRENNNRIQNQILGEELSPAQLRALRAKQDMGYQDTNAAKKLRQLGTAAEEGERVVAPVVNSAAKIVQSVSPFRSFKTETTRSGSTWKDPNTGANHYQDSTFNNRFKGW